ncbi:flagellar hook-associated protein FlgK [Oceanobacter mangrovi]|uniref:flagellar hook-associated protein FlgK n=1 Tax=Oceanobacter mangrovi TaxID=2862510 RepID=UPI001C8D5785|nr:flagellar hook-associated protein FlgK [Oceanobacter mangrovi]
MADILSIAISGLQSQQTALSVTGNNISNAGTEGYSRQTVSFSENSSQYLAGNWLGSGVSVDSVSRIYDQYLTEQMWQDSTEYNYYNTMSDYAGRVDSLLADSTTGVQPGLEAMFTALQAVVDDPSSISTREVLLTEAGSLTDRFAVVSDQLYALNTMINGQMAVQADEVSAIAASIAQLNEDIAFAIGKAQGDEPSTLLDQRDRLITQLSEMIDISVGDLGNSQVNIYMGDGLPLVTGTTANTLYASRGEVDPSRYSLYLVSAGRTSEVTEQVTGGNLGATVDFRDEILDPTLNSLGKLALVIAEQMNEQQSLGLDYDGEQGQNFFQDINSDEMIYQRAIGDDNNANPDDRILSVYITDAGNLSTSDFTLEFTGPDDYNYQLTDNSTGKVVQKGAITGDFPDIIEIDGAEIHLESGSFQQGDLFMITPTRNEASNIEVDLTLAEQIALASPIATAASYGNQGSAAISAGSVSDIDTFAFNDDGELDPPLLIRFTSSTSYEVLDNSDPANPVPLQPPISNQPYVAGISNTINLGSTSQYVTSSYVDQLPLKATYQAELPATQVTPGNGFTLQRFDISYTDPVSGQYSHYSDLSIPANTSAKDIAAALSEYPGVEATARTTMQLSNFQADDDGFQGMEVTLNGIVLTDSLTTAQTKYEDDYPATVPDPMTADFIADRINANFDFQEMGITATSDGETVTITALNGEDLQLEISGDGGDSVDVGNGQDIQVTSTGADPFKPLNVYEGYDFSDGGPYTYTFETAEQGSFEFQLTENYDSPEAMLQGIREAITDAGFDFNGELDVDIDERGNINFQPRLEVSGTGIHGSNKLTLGGQLTVVVDEGVELVNETRSNNLFALDMQYESSYMGMEVAIAGSVVAGDSFTIGNNENAITDSRNGTAMLALQATDTVNGTSTFSEAYSTLVEQVGSITNRSQNSLESAEVLLQASEAAISSVSGVNLDEEAANLIQYELAYNANAQVIQVARSIFETLIATFN